MSIEAWALLWKYVLFLGVGVFALLAVLVTIGGLADIKRMLAELAHPRDRDPDANR